MFDTHGLHSQTNCQSTCFVHRNYLIEHEASRQGVLHVFAL